MIVSRFAPAPTGFLHLGHVVNALHVWGITRVAGGRVLLRIEDHDRKRCRSEYERAILDDLDWLGFVPDEPSTDAFRAGPCRGRQRDRQDVYESALSRLTEMGLVYACGCSRRELRAETANGHDRQDNTSDVEVRYSGRCRSRHLQWSSGLGLRVRLVDSVERFCDLRHGWQEQRPSAQCGDLLVKDRDDNWTYQFAVTADDMAQGVNLVIRGDDLLPSTGRQMQLSRLLGRVEPPRYLHHALIMKSPNQKLSKADQDTSVRDMRTEGCRVDEVIGRAMHAASFAESAAPITRAAAERRVVSEYADAIELLIANR
jgi:glutamyl-tRNA synthetase/glutamyl-Q tRNA(Asp) synthetase